MNSHSARPPEGPLAGGTNGSADDAPLAPDQVEPTLRMPGNPNGKPGGQDESGMTDPDEDDEYDEYEPL